MNILDQASYLITDWLHFMEGSRSEDHAPNSPEGADGVPTRSPQSIQVVMASCVFRRVFSSPGWAPDGALGSYVPRMMLNSEGWDMVDNIYIFIIYIFLLL